MKRVEFVRVLAFSVAVGSLAALPAVAAPEAYVGAAQAKGEPAKGKKAKLPMGKRGQLPKTLKLAPRGLEWGLGLRAIANLYDKHFESEFLKLYKKVPVGSPRERVLDAELKDKKAQIRRNVVEFEDVPTGVDYTPLKGEYSYRNGESMAYVTLRDGTKRHFFFFNGKLWKVYDEHKLRPGGPLGGTFAEAVGLLKKKLHAEPLKVAQNFEKGQTYAQATWSDSDKYIRAVDREGEGIIALVYVEKEVQDNLARRRPNKPKDPHEMDKSVESALRKGPPDGPPEGDDKKGNKKK